jgi:hypothetical protein
MATENMQKIMFVKKNTVRPLKVPSRCLITYENNNGDKESVVVNFTNFMPLVIKNLEDITACMVIHNSSDISNLRVIRSRTLYID